MLGSRRESWWVASGLALAIGTGAIAEEQPGRPDESGLAERPALVHRVPVESPEAGIVRIELDPAIYARMLTERNVVVHDFPLPGDVVVDLELQRFDVLAPGARLIEAGIDGEREAPPPAFRAYRGRVAGQPGSSVTLSAFSDRIAGSIRTTDDQFVVAPNAFDGETRHSKMLHVWQREADPDRPEGPLCEADVFPDRAHAAVLEDPEELGVSAAPAGIGSGTLLTAHVAIDATYDWFTHFGSLSAAQNYILNLMSQVSTIYENDLDVEIDIPFLRVFTTPNGPYTNGELSASALLGELRSEWNANGTGTDRTVVHLFSRRPSGGSGIAYLDVLCNHTNQPGFSYDYGVSTLSANGGSWEKDLVAHELGHNFSSPHTHCYSPPIDHCASASGCYSGTPVPTVGTIMSYCSQSVPSFHPRVLARIRPEAEAAAATCMTVAGTDPETVPAPQNLRRTDILQ